MLQNQNATSSAITTATTPPATPPAIAPTGTDEPDFDGGAVLEDSDVEVDVVEDVAGEVEEVGELEVILEEEFAITPVEPSVYMM